MPVHEEGPINDAIRFLESVAMGLDWDHLCLDLAGHDRACFRVSVLDASSLDIRAWVHMYQERRWVKLVEYLLWLYKDHLDQHLLPHQYACNPILVERKRGVDDGFVDGC